MDTEATGSGRPLELRCEAIAPWLWRVAWAAGGTVATDDEREQIAQVAASRANGALVVIVDVVPTGPQTTSAETSVRVRHLFSRLLSSGIQPKPWELAPIADGISYGGRDDFVAPGALGDGRLKVYAPRGRGRVVQAMWPSVQAADEQFVAPLAARPATQAMLARIDALLAELSSRNVPRLSGRGPWLDDGELTPTSPELARFDYVADGDDRHFEVGTRRRFDSLLWIARLCRGGEAFTLRPRVGGRSLERAQLVLVRATAAADRGALLRVFLDDEDLGPWRLGDGRTADEGSYDLFRISSDLLAGREQVRLEFKLENRREIAALRWWFLHEEEPDGTWLTELEAAAEGGVAPRADRAADGGLLVHDDELFLRGLELASGARVRYALPRGERRLEFAFARADDRSKSAARLRLDGNGTSTSFDLASGRRARSDVALALTASESGFVTLANEGEAPLLLLSPKLLR